MKTNKGSVSQFIGSCAALLPRAWAVLILAVAVAVEAGGVTLKVDRIKQRYPWNGLVDIDYTIQWGAGESPDRNDRLEVLMVDNSVQPAVTNRAARFLQTPVPMTDGPHRITWDANCDGVTNRVAAAEFHVKIVRYSEAYMLIDVSNGADDDKTYPVTFMDHEPEGGFNQDLYKSSVIVLRRIHPGSYIAGSPSDEASREGGANGIVEKQHPVSISRPFYIGIFEVTQRQYYNVMGSVPTGMTWGDYYPVDKVFNTAIRGGNWPDDPSIGSDTFIGKLISKCRKEDPRTHQFTEPMTGFDLPTEFQWEYACRAGTTGAISTTNEFDNTNAEGQLAELVKMGQVGTTAFAKVGSFEPNPWGLYDMYGNAWECCLDWFVKDVVALKQYVDPVGPETGLQRVSRGGSATNGIGDCRSGKRNSSSGADNRFGFRLCCTMAR